MCLESTILNDDGQQFLERYGKGSKDAGWYSFDKKGVHFISLVNVMNLKAGGLSTLGHDQLEWLEDDVKHWKHSTPIVVFAHIPLWTAYPEWGWATEDSGVLFDFLGQWTKHCVLTEAAYYNFLVAASATIPVVVTGLVAWQWALEGQLLKRILLMHLMRGCLSSLLIWVVWLIHKRTKRKEVGVLPGYRLPIEP